VGFAAEKRPTGPPGAEKIALGVLVFLKRAHGSQAAEVAKPIFECGLRLTDCGLKRAEERGGDGSTARQDDKSLINLAASTPPNPQSIKVRSVSENVTRELPLEEYLVGALAAESSIEDEVEALKAQAVVSRSFALKNLGRHSREGYDFCSTTHCQRFTFPKTKSAVSGAARRAVEETAGLILSDPMGRVIDAYFHAACGGVTANIETLWGAPAPSYLRGVRDDFCAAGPHRHWAQKIPANQLARALQSDERTNVGERLVSITVSRRDATGRAETVTIEGARRLLVRGWDFKLIVGRSLGWQMIKSSRFEVSRAGDSFIFRGSGFGHGLGLCQEGAHVAARRGMSYRQILNHYFPGTRLTRMDPGRFDRQSRQGGGHEPAAPMNLAPASFNLLPTNIGASQKLSLSSEHFRVSYPAGSDRRSIEKMLDAFENARADLLRRLEAASLRLAEPGPFEVLVHAKIADFITATGQQGWAAGATRGRRIELQPLDLLRRRGVLNTTLRHELTHAVIEVLGGGRAPRWLAEGLAIHVAGESATLPRIDIKNRLSREDLERKLMRSSPVAESRELYAMAYHEVLEMIESEGESSVWRRVAKARGNN
jgi:stage II sporulation protein D